MKARLLVRYPEGHHRGATVAGRTWHPYAGKDRIEEADALMFADLLRAGGAEVKVELLGEVPP